MNDAEEIVRNTAIWFVVFGISVFFGVLVGILIYSKKDFKDDGKELPQKN